MLVGVFCNDGAFEAVLYGCVCHRAVRCDRSRINLVRASRRAALLVRTLALCRRRRIICVACCFWVCLQALLFENSRRIDHVCFATFPFKGRSLAKQWISGTEGQQIWATCTRSSAHGRLVLLLDASAEIDLEACDSKLRRHTLEMQNRSSHEYYSLDLLEASVNWGGRSL